MGCLSADEPDPEKPSAAEQQQLAQARDSWANYKSSYIPLEEKQMQRIAEMRSVSERQQAVSGSVSEAKAAMGPSSALAPGEAAGSGSHIRRSLALESSQGDLVANAIMNAEQGQEERYVRGRQRVIDFGLGKASTAALMTGRSAQMGAATNAINTSSRNSMSAFNNNMKNEAYGTAAGMAASFAPAAGEAFREWGDSRRAKKLDQNQYNASGGGYLVSPGDRMG